MLKWVLILGGVVVFCLGVFTAFEKQEAPVNQIAAMIGIAILTITAGIAIKNRS